MDLPPPARFALAGALAALALAASPPAFAAAPGATFLADLPTGLGALPAAGAQSTVLTAGRRQLSDDGRSVVFASGAGGLLPGGGDGHVHVFRRDLVTGETIALDRASGADGALGDADASAPELSADGTTVAFLTAAALDPADTNGLADVYVRRIDTGVTVLASRGDGAAGSLADAPAAHPALSGDGSRVAWDSTATTMGDGARAGVRSVHLRVLGTGRTLLVARSDLDGVPADGDTQDAALDATGTVAAFEGTAANLVPGTGTTRHILVRDLAAGTTRLVDRAGGASGAPADGASRDPAISADGTRVAFTTTAANLGDGDADTTADVHLRDLTAATTTLVSRADGTAGAKGDVPASGPAISADGGAVAFTSAAPLAPGLPVGVTQAWVRFPATGRTVLASRADGEAGAAADADATAAALDADASCALFATSAPALGAAPVLDPALVRAHVRVLSRECPLVAPQTSIDGGPAGAVTLGLPAQFTFSADEPGVTFACRLDDAPFAPCASPATVTPGSAGPHTFQVRATDRAGLTDATPASLAFTVVDPPPVLLAATMKNRTFKVAKRSTPLAARLIRTGSSISWTLSKAAQVTFTVRALTTGRLVNGRCLQDAPWLRGRLMCSRRQVAGVLRRTAVRGGGTLLFSGRLGRRALRPGAYDVTLVATDRAGQSSAPRVLRFRIAR